MFKPVLPIIVIAQFFCTSVWFAGNAVITELSKDLGMGPHFLADLTSAIQFGFITGTLVFALLAIADRFSPSKVFFFSAIFAGLFNLGISIHQLSATEILLCRFITGFFLAGIYPVGMKIAADHYQAGLGKSLGFLVGALVLGTAIPHLLKHYSIDFAWTAVFYSTTLLCFAGGLAVALFVPNGPFRKPAQKIQIASLTSVFKHQKFRSAAFGYFGHMWELYSFWAFVPLMLTAYNNRYPAEKINVALCSFFIVGIGALACVLSGLASKQMGAKKLAVFSLSLSCLCCLLSPFFLFTQSVSVFLLFMFIWGFSVIADSPLFSTLVAQNAPKAIRGSSLTIVNCIGFAITIISIQCINFLEAKISSQYIFMFLAIGPLLGLVALVKGKNKPVVINIYSNEF